MKKKPSLNHCTSISTSSGQHSDTFFQPTQNKRTVTFKDKFGKILHKPPGMITSLSVKYLVKSSYVPKPIGTVQQPAIFQISQLQYVRKSSNVKYLIYKKKTDMN